MARLYVYRTEICVGYAIKSFKWFYNSAPKEEQYYPLQSLAYLTRVNIKYNSSHDFAAYYYISTRL
jgi:hypothetical protein